MIKKISLLALMLLVATMTLLPNQAKAAIKPAYDYQWVRQSGYPTNLTPGQTTQVWVEVKNTGTATWHNTGNNIVYLGTGADFFGAASQKRDYVSEAYDPHSWIGSNRATTFVMALAGGIIPPGYNTRFTFNIKAPSVAGTYRSYFTPVVENVTWMKDIGMYWDITVLSATGNPDAVRYFNANPESVASGGSTTLSWDVNPNYNQCSISNGVGTVQNHGSIIVPNMTQTTDFQLACSQITTSGSGAAIADVVVNVEGTGIDITSFAASRKDVGYGESSSLSWTTKNVDACSIDNGIGNVPVNGTQSVLSITQNTTYKLTCTRSTSAGTETIANSLMIAIVNSNAKPSIIYFDALSTTAGQSGYVGFRSTGATSCSIDNGIGSVSTGEDSATTPILNNSTTFTLTCTNSHGSTTQSAVVTVSQ
jgi:hypothetical protein